MRILFSAIVTVMIAALFVSEVLAEERIALVIGNSAYANAPLANPKNDANLMADTLERVGFKVTRLIDVDQKTMKRAMVGFGRKLRRSDSVGLFYYAGHGVQIEGENFLIPIGAVIGDELEVGIEAVSVNDFLRTMKRARSRINIVVLDACRNNPYARSFRSNVRGLARVDAPKGTYVAYATSPGSIALDGRTKHSPYTTALTSAILKPGLLIEQVFKQARRDVLVATNDRQTPWETSSITGRFYFQPPLKKAAQPVKPSLNNNSALELAFWDTVKNSHNPALLRSYLRQYPSGVFSDLANVMIEQLETDSTAANTASQQARSNTSNGGSQQEVLYWNTVKDSSDPALLNAYLEKFPDGIFSGLARVMISRAEKAQQTSREEQRVAVIAPEASGSLETPEERSDPDLSRKIQSALENAGCSPGTVDGVWGRKSSAALALFAEHANVTLPVEDVSPETLNLFEGRLGRACPLVCDRGQIITNDRCVAKAPTKRKPAKRKKVQTTNAQKKTPPRKKKLVCHSYGCDDIEETRPMTTQRKAAPRKKKIVCHSYGCDDEDGW